MPTVRRIKSVKWDEDDLYDYYSEDDSDYDHQDDDFAEKPRSKSSNQPNKQKVVLKKDVAPKTSQPKPVCQTQKSAPLYSSQNASNDSKNTLNRYPLNVVVLGAVDAGKSTLLGHFLTLTNCVDKKLKNIKHLSWILDQGEDERDRGITIDPTKCQFNLSLDRKLNIPNLAANSANNNALIYDSIKVNVIDTPGHHDLIQNLVMGAVFANAAVIIIDSNDVLKSEIFSTYFSEHMLLLYILGIRYIIVCINKIDKYGYSEETYNKIIRELNKLIRYYESSVNFTFMPVSALNGDNLIARSPNLSWYKGPLLMESLQAVSLDIINKPVVIYDKVICHIFDLWESGKSVSCSCFVEGSKLKVPIDMHTLPDSVHVKFTSAQSLPIPLVTLNQDNSLNEVTNDGSYVNDFVDCVEMKGTEIANLLGTKIMIDSNTHSRIKNNSSSIVRTVRFWGFLYLNAMNKLKLTIGQNVEIFIGYTKQSAHIRSMELVEKGLKTKKTFSISPGQFAFVEFLSNSPMLVEPISMDSTFLTNMIDTFHKAFKESNDLKYNNYHDERGAFGQNDTNLKVATARDHKAYDSHVGILSRLLVRSFGNFIAGGVAVSGS